MVPAKSGVLLIIGYETMSTISTTPNFSIKLY
jgi:hypothetical protein